MCGIAGRVNFASGRRWRRDRAAMCDLIAHRGPDGHGVYCDGAVGFGHRRLAIIDLSPAARSRCGRPTARWSSRSTARSTTTGSCRPNSRKGHAFRTESDTEVILAAYREWGPRA